MPSWPIVIPPQPRPSGPRLTYCSQQDSELGWQMIDVDRVAPTDPRERALCRALLVHALALIDAEQ